MIKINLLPWREYKREQQKKFFTTVSLAGVGVAVLLVLLANYYLIRQINNQTERNQKLKNEITVLDTRIQIIEGLKKFKAALIARMEIVKNLQSTRPLTVHFFDELIKVTPPGVVVTKIERINYGVTIWGYAESNSNISELMRNIEEDEWIQNPSLTEIKKAGEQKQKGLDNEFKLSFSLVKEKVDKDTKVIKK